MGPFSSGILMMHLLLKCYGHTYLYVKDGHDATIRAHCKESIWRIDTDCKVRQNKLNVPHAKGCGDSFCYDMQYRLEAKSGFYVCGRHCDPHSVEPFSPHTNLDTYVVALRSEQLVDEQRPQAVQSVSVTEDSSIPLSCSFTGDIGPHQPYVVYWLRMSMNGSSSCISSYSSERKNHVQHCPTDPRFTSLSPAEDRQSSHDLRMGSSRLSDSGVYVCVLHRRRRANEQGRNRQRSRDKKSRKTRQDQSEPDSDDEGGGDPEDKMEDTQRGRAQWIIIRNLTVTVKRKDKPNPHRKPPRSLMGLHVATAFFLITLLALILLLAWRKMKSSQAHQAQEMPRSPSGGGGNTDLDCSPYAVGFRQAEPYSVVNISKQMDSARSTPVGPSGLSSDVPEPYSVIELGTQEGSAASTPAGQTSDVCDAYSVITLNDS